MKNERQKLASTAAPIESAEPGGRGWLPSLRPSWLPAKPDAGASVKNALEQERAREDEVKALTQEIAALKASLASEVSAKTQAADQLAQEASGRKQAEEEGTLLLAQLHQVQEELERYYLANKALEKDASALAQEKAALAQEKAKAIAALRASLAAEAKAKAQAAEQLAHEISLRKQADEEGVLLLTQLHEVQEELERYYLDNKDLQASLRQASARFGRIVSRQPDGIDWETVHIQPLTVDGEPALRCTAVDVAVTGKEWKTLDFFAFEHDGVLSFSFERGEDASGAGPLTRWPRTAAALPALTVRVGEDAYDEPNLNVLKEFSTSDWDMLRGLPRLISQGLQSAPGSWPVEQPALDQWQNAAQTTPSAINELQVALRYDAFKIQGATNLPGYENLQIQLKHLDLGEKRFESFEFRFACNLGAKGEFGLNARLEFFKLNGVPVFENWTPNYRDGQRERLDLVFVFPSTLNLKEFSALSTKDRALVLLLADLLPALLTDASPNGLALNRPLAEWTALAQNLRSFVRARLDVTGVQRQPGALVDAASQSALSPAPDTAPSSKRRAALRGVRGVSLPLAKAKPKALPMPLKLRKK